MRQRLSQFVAHQSPEPNGVVMSRFDIKTCKVCGEIEFEDKMLEYNDKHFCGIRCKIIQERIDDEKLANPTSRGVRYSEH